MSLNAVVISRRPPRHAFRELLLSEAKLAWRTPVGLVLGVAIPILLLVIFGSIPAFRKPISLSNPTLVIDIYVPVLMALVLVLIALVSLPITLVVQRERGWLRRMSTTPVAPLWLLAAQVVINLFLVAVAMTLIVTGGAAFFGAHAPSEVPGFLLSTGLATAALFAIGLLIAAIAPSARVAAVMGTVVLYPLMFFAGLWTPRETMSEMLRHISDLTPLGAGVQAMQTSMLGTFPSWQPLLVMAAWAIVCGVAAVKAFRWE